MGRRGASKAYDLSSLDCVLYVYIAVGPLALTPPDSPALEKGAHKRRGWLPEKATARDEGVISQAA